MSKGWDSIALKKLKALTGKGLSTSEIGKRLGMSKNAIVGKLNRLGWNAKANAAPADVSDKKTKKMAEKPEKVQKSAKKTVTEKAVAGKKTTKATTKATTSKVADKKKTVVEKKADKESGKKSGPKVAVKASTKADAKNLAVHQRIIQHSLEMANLKPNQCRWPIGDPDSEGFHFCGETVFVGKPYCYEHCKQAYQFTPPKKNK
ncbi:MAG: hypothetical protein J6K82_00090 [Alphaproteobacteria bacterium]|nr:hypothetical protein [Alphaproteobacteria bacterium]